MRASSPRCSSRRAGVRAPSEGESGRWPTGRSPASRSSTVALVGVQLGQRRRQVGRAAGRAARWPGGPARPGGGRRGAPGRGRAARRRPTAAPGWSAGRSAGGERRRRARRAAPRPASSGGDAVGRGEQHDVEHLQGRGVQLVERAVDRDRARRAGWPAPRRRTARGARRRDGPPAGRSAARRCGCAARRRASQGGPWASGPRYVGRWERRRAGRAGRRGRWPPWPSATRRTRTWWSPPGASPRTAARR